ncbi:GGDEF domain-containing protein [Halanaerobium hydrogeniformans]|uniref:Diguanylate cyclase n=1 Tax=Halanaerobium hydrogeniformans TaxID=656519 RepID=E4RKZ5_HALHG|nr:GGDEF domain-containing protein [Halanaerobium hydrogeniformans]ADQ15736.1 diguanylate cyclase [Halanaerobium hydrogeniformans]
MQNNLINEETLQRLLEENKGLKAELEAKTKEIKYLSYHDELTGLYNRKFVYEEVKRLKESDSFPISVIIISLNKLKMINENHGHTQGDKYIKKAADLLKKNFNEGEILARIAGDELAVVLKKTEQEQVDKIAEQLNNSFDQANINNSKEFSLSIALGTSTMDARDAEV